MLIFDGGGIDGKINPAYLDLFKVCMERGFFLATPLAVKTAWEVAKIYCP